MFNPCENFENSITKTEDFSHSLLNSSELSSPSANQVIRQMSGKTEMQGFPSADSLLAGFTSNDSSLASLAKFAAGGIGQGADLLSKNGGLLGGVGDYMSNGFQAIQDVIEAELRLAGTLLGFKTQEAGHGRGQERTWGQHPSNSCRVEPQPRSSRSHGGDPAMELASARTAEQNNDGSFLQTVKEILPVVAEAAPLVLTMLA